MSAYAAKAPWWYWAVALLATLWMLFGVLAWVMDLRMTPEQLALLPDAQQQLYALRPQWVFLVYAVAVFSGLAGAIGLLLRKRWATTWFLVSLVALDAGEVVQGRTAVALDDDHAWMLWVREGKDGQSLWLSRRSPDLAEELQRMEVAKLQGRGKATGFPQLALHHGNAYVVWTDVIDGAPQLRGAIVAPANG